MKILVRFTIMLALIQVLVPIAAAQNSGTLKGVILDPAKASLPHVLIRLVSQADKHAFETASDEAGQFEFTGLPFGAYVLQAKVPGFEPVSIPLKVDATPVTALRVHLRIASESEEVTVTASADPVLGDQNKDSVEVNRKLLSEVPVKDGDALALATLFLNPAALGSGGVNIVVDGVESSNLDIPLSTIRAIRINKNPYSAEFSRPGDGRIEVITQKGSQHHYHRRVASSFRNSALNARNAFARVKPPFHRELLEGELDGPIMGERVTFLVGAEYLINHANAVVRAQTPAGAVLENVATPERKLRFLGRIDFRLKPTHITTVRYKFKTRSRENQGVGGFNLVERGNNVSDGEHQVRISDSAIHSANFVNESRLSLQTEHRDSRSKTNHPSIIVLDAFSAGGSQVSQRQRETSLDLQDVATLIKGRHSLRFGGGWRPRLLRVSDASNFGGTFTFSSLLDFTRSQPFLFTVNQGNPEISFTQQEFFYFLQDEIRLRPSFSFSVGLRHELQSNLDDHGNLAPRVTLAYAPGNGRIVFRAGAGIFYERQPVVMQQQSLLLDGSRIRQAVISNPGFPQPLNPLDLAVFPTPSVVRLAQNIHTPYLIQTGAGFERAFGKYNSLAVEYTLLRGLRLYRTRNINAPAPGTHARPDPGFVNINQFESTGSSRSHNLALTLQLDVGGRLKLISQYTLSRATDDTSGLFSLPANNFDLRSEWGRADFDRRHRLNLAGMLRLPLGFKLGMVGSLTSGVPFNITTGFDDNGDTVANDRPLGVARNTGKGPGFASVDARLSRKFRTTKHKDSSNSLEFRLDVFNIFNHVNYINFIGTLSSPFFGRANAAYPARELQLSLNFKF